MQTPEPSDAAGQPGNAQSVFRDWMPGRVPVAATAAPGAASVLDGRDEYDLSPAVQARLTEEVLRLVAALTQFARGAQAVAESPAAVGQLDKPVAQTLALVGFQLSNSFARDPKGFGLLACSLDDVQKMELNMRQLFHELQLDGRRFLAVALCDQSGNEVLHRTPGGEQGAELDHDAALRDGA